MIKVPKTQITLLLVIISFIFSMQFNIKDLEKNQITFIEKTQNQEREKQEKLFKDAIEKVELASMQQIKEKEEQKKSLEKINEIKKELENKKKQTNNLYERILFKPLGATVAVHEGERSSIYIHTINQNGYKGHMARVRLHDPTAIKMVLASDSVQSFGETTSNAAKRNDAIFGINAGGFYWNGRGLAPTGTTIIDGKIETYSEKAMYIGFDENGNLVSDRPTSPSQIPNNITQAASFHPEIIVKGKPVSNLGNSGKVKHPRTIVGQYENGDLLFLAIDGRQRGWSTGVTLVEAQRLLKDLNIKNAYNFDGGGSTSMYFNGKVYNRPSDGSERRVVTNILISP